jgi:hypothetical protein
MVSGLETYNKQNYISSFAYSDINEFKPDLRCYCNIYYTLKFENQTMNMDISISSEHVSIFRSKDTGDIKILISNKSKDSLRLIEEIKQISLALHGDITPEIYYGLRFNLYVKVNGISDLLFLMCLPDNLQFNNITNNYIFSLRYNEFYTLNKNFTQKLE